MENYPKNVSYLKLIEVSHVWWYDLFNTSFIWSGIKKIMHDSLKLIKGHMDSTTEYQGCEYQHYL